MNQVVNKYMVCVGVLMLALSVVSPVQAGRPGNRVPGTPSVTKPTPACSQNEYAAYATLTSEYTKMSVELAKVTADIAMASQEIHDQIANKDFDLDAIIEIANTLLADATSLEKQSQASLSVVGGILIIQNGMIVGPADIDESMIIKGVSDSIVAYQSAERLASWVVDFSNALMEANVTVLVDLAKQLDELVVLSQTVTEQFTVIAADLAASSCVPSK